MKTLVTLLLVAGLLGGYTAHAAEPDPSGMVTVRTVENVPPATARAGFVADTAGHIIARIKSNATLHIKTADGTELTAHTVKYDEISELALLKVTSGATTLKPYLFGHSPTKPERKVSAIKIKQGLTGHEVVAGTVSDIRQQDAQSPGYYRHNAVVGNVSAGGPLFNNCGEVVGVIILKSRPWLQRVFAGKDLDVVEYAVSIEWLESQFASSGINLERASAVCLSEAEQKESAEQAAAQAGVEAEAAQVEAEKAQAELDAAKRKLEDEKNVSEEEKQKLQEEITARQNALDEAKERAEEAQTTLDTANKEIQQAQVREEQYILWGGSALGLLLLVIVLVLILRRRAVNRERREKIAAQSGLAKREQEEARIRRVPAVFLEGTDAVDSDGQRVALRIPGASIATTGAIIGRNPTESDFVINHPQVSRKHFRLFLAESALMIEDLHSTNGTIVDGNTLKAGEQIALNDTSRIECGHFHLVLRIERE